MKIDYLKGYLILFSLLLLFISIFNPCRFLLTIVPNPYDTYLEPRWLLLVVFILVTLFFVFKTSHIEFFPSNSRLSKLDSRYFSRFGNLILIQHSHHASNHPTLHHEILIRGKYICLGCYSTISGLIFGLGVMIVYLMQVSPRVFDVPVLWVISSVLGIMIGLIKYYLPSLTPKIRLITHFGFGLSFPLFLLAIDNLWNSLLNNVLTSGILMMILVVRLYLSQLEHP